MKYLSLAAALGLGGLISLGSASGLAQTIPGQIIPGQPGWDCTIYRLVPGQQWICGQWSFLGDQKLAPPPGFTNQTAMAAKADAAPAEPVKKSGKRRQHAQKKRQH